MGTLGYSFTAAVGGYDVNGNPVYVREAVAPLLDGLCRDYANRGWGKLDILEGGRTNARQWYLWNGFASGASGFYPAAYPGSVRSYHEGGYAVDFGSQWNSYYKTGWARLAQIAPRWGFDNVQGRNTGQNGEPWHWVCTPANATTRDNGLQLVGIDIAPLNTVPRPKQTTTKAGRKVTMFLRNAADSRVASIPEGGPAYVFQDPAEYNRYREVVRVYNDHTKIEAQEIVPPLLTDVMSVPNADFMMVIKVHGAGI